MYISALFALGVLPQQYVDALRTYIRLGLGSDFDLRQGAKREIVGTLSTVSVFIVLYT